MVEAYPHSLESIVAVLLVRQVIHIQEHLHTIELNSDIVESFDLREEEKDD